MGERGMQAIHEALSFDALVAFMENEIGIWSIGQISRKDAKSPRQILAEWMRHSGRHP